MAYGDAGPDAFTNDISAKKYVNLLRMSRATAYPEITVLCEMGVQYKLEGFLSGITDTNAHAEVDFGRPVGRKDL